MCTELSNTASQLLVTADIIQSQLATEEITRNDDGFLDSNWNLPKYFGHIKVITMNQEGARFKRFLDEISKIGLKPSEFEVVPGIDGKTLEASLWNRMDSWDIRRNICPIDYLERRKQGQMGCFMAHYKAIKSSAQMYHQTKAEFERLQSCPGITSEQLVSLSNQLKKYSSVLIIEDNNGFGCVTGLQNAELKTYGRKFREVMKDIPLNWDMFYFMSMSHWRNTCEAITPRLAKLSFGVVTKCYAIHAFMYDRIVKVLEDTLNGDQKIQPVDNVIATLHPHSNCYVATPPLTYRVASESQVLGDKIPDAPFNETKNWQSDATKK